MGLAGVRQNGVNFAVVGGVAGRVVVQDVADAVAVGEQDAAGFCSFVVEIDQTISSAFLCLKTLCPIWVSWDYICGFRIHSLHWWLYITLLTFS